MKKPEFIRHKFPTLQEMHVDWEVNCMPVDAPDIQHKECQKAFKAGVASLFHVLKLEIPEVSDDEGIGYLNRLDDQLVEFFTKAIFEL